MLERDNPRRTCTKSVEPKNKKQKTDEEQDPLYIEELPNILKVDANISDECSTFGQHIAHKLRSYDKKTRNIVQYQINTILYYADMGNPNLHIPCNTWSPHQPVATSTSTVTSKVSRSVLSTEEEDTDFIDTKVSIN